MQLILLFDKKRKYWKFLQVCSTMSVSKTVSQKPDIFMTRRRFRIISLRDYFLYQTQFGLLIRYLAKVTRCISPMCVCVCKLVIKFPYLSTSHITFLSCLLVSYFRFVSPTLSAGVQTRMYTGTGEFIPRGCIERFATKSPCVRTLSALTYIAI